MIAGPCSVESGEQLLSVAKELKNLGVNILRGGAYKPRTSPYSFQGLGKEGLILLKEETFINLVKNGDILALLISSILYFLIGAFTFRIAEKIAKDKGLLGHY